MMRTGRTVPLRRLMLTLGLLAVIGAVVPVPPVAAATDRLPDLRVAPISDFHLVTSGGRRLLRFTGVMWNNGAGPLESRSNRSQLLVPDLDRRPDHLRQRRRLAAGPDGRGDAVRRATATTTGTSAR